MQIEAGGSKARDGHFLGSETDINISMNVGTTLLSAAKSGVCLVAGMRLILSWRS